MKEVKKVLFPIDLSEVSPKIAPWALDIAGRFDAEIHLLFVARVLGHYAGIYVEPALIENFEAEVVKGAEAKIEEFANTHFKKHPVCVTRVLVGDVAEEILKYAESEKIDLIIIGTHGRKGLDRILFGSIAEKVIKMSPVPVLSINPYKLRAA